MTEVEENTEEHQEAAHNICDSVCDSDSKDSAHSTEDIASDDNEAVVEPAAVSTDGVDEIDDAVEVEVESMAEAEAETEVEDVNSVDPVAEESEAYGAEKVEELAAAQSDTEGSDQNHASEMVETEEVLGEEGSESSEMTLVDHEVDSPLIEVLSANEARHIQTQEEDETPDEEHVPDVLDMPPSELRGVVEALLLVSNKPLKIERIEKCLPGSCRNYLGGFLRGLSECYAREQRGWDLRSVGGGWQLLTRVQFHPWVRQLDKRELPTRLSKSAMETLAIVAYKQPVSRGRIEDIRGVQCGPMLRQLMDMHLIIVTGRDENALGRPLLYATSEQFLERFGLSAAADLPRQHEFGG